MTALARDPQFLFPDSDAGRAQIIAYLNKPDRRHARQMPKLSRLKLKAPVQVKRVPPDIQDGAAQGYMNPGAMDGSRPSTYYINLKDHLELAALSAAHPDLSRNHSRPCLAGRLSDRNRQAAADPHHSQRLQCLCRRLGALCRATGRRNRHVCRRSLRRTGLSAGAEVPRLPPGGGYRTACQALDARAGDRLVGRAITGSPRAGMHQRGRPLLRLAGPGLRLQGRPYRDQCACATRRKPRWARSSTCATINDTVVKAGAVPLTVLAQVIDAHIAMEKR